MPLSEKARIEVYVPDLPDESYQTLLHALVQEFTYTFGGCTIIHSLDGAYLSELGDVVPDYINLIYTDVPLSFQANFETISSYTDEVRRSVFAALDEEAVLVTAHPVFHSE